MRRLLLVAMVAAGLAACEPKDNYFGPAGGDACVRDCAGKQCGTDGCGGECGTCEPGSTCRAEVGLCECAETDAALCARVGAQCGSLTAVDACHVERTVDCGPCTPPETCDEARNECVCVGESREAFCARYGRECGPLTGPDNCVAARTEPDCGSCREGWECSAEGTCVCDGEDEEELCAAAELECGSHLLVDKCGEPRSIESCGECTGGDVCLTTGRCGLPVPDNDHCSGAQLVEVGPGVRSEAGDTTFASDSTAPSCAPAGVGNVPDVVFTFAIPHGEAWTATLQVVPPAGSPMRPLVALRAACDEPTSELGCSLADAANQPASLLVSRLVGGSYFVWVESDSPGTGGPFTLSIELTPAPEAPENDACQDAIELELEPLNALADRALRTGTTWGATHQGSGTCALPGEPPHSGADVVYTLTLQSEAILAARVTRSAATPDYRPAVYIRSDCESALPDAEKGCASSPGASATAVARTTLLPAGTYWVVVDGLQGSAGDFELEVSAVRPTLPVPMPNDECSGARVLSFDEQGQALEAGTTFGASGSGSSKDCGGSGADVVYTFTTEVITDITLELTPFHGGASVLYVRTVCEDPNSELKCQDVQFGAVNRLEMLNQPPATFYVWVDGVAVSGPMPFTLRVELEEAPVAPANDDCAKAVPVPIDPESGQGSLSSSTLYATNDRDGRCKSGGSGGELYFTFTLDTPRNVQVEVKPDEGSAHRPLVYLLASCEPGAEQRFCGMAPAAQREVTLSMARLGEGTYLFAVDGYNAESNGPFTLTVTTASLEPAANDTCSGAEELFFEPGSDQVTRTAVPMLVANDDYAGSPACAGTGPHSGPDLVYYFALQAPHKVTVRVQRNAAAVSYRPVVYLRRTCESADPMEQVACANDAYSTPGTARATAVNLPAGTWYLIVDGANGTFGTFDLEVTREPPLYLPSGCLNAQTLTFGSDGKASVQVDATAATDNSQSLNCSAPPGRDLVYHFSTVGMRKQDLTATVRTPGGGVTPALYLRRRCDSLDRADELACTVAPNTQAGLLTLERSALPEGEYYLWIESVSSLDLELTLTRSPTEPSNERCESAELLSFVDGRARVSGDIGGADDDATGTCGFLNGPDAVYRFEVSPSEGAGVDVVVLRAPGASPLFEPAVYLRRDCLSAAPADEVGCDLYVGNGRTVLSLPHVAPGVYYLFVDAQGGAAGRFELDVALAAPRVAPSTCAASWPLAFDPSGQAFARNNSAGAQDDATGTCGAMTGPDQVYHFTLQQSAGIVASVRRDPASTAFTPAVYIRNVCDRADAEAEVACAVHSGGVATATAALLVPGTYYVFVDGTGGAGTPGTFGGYLLELVQLAPATNDDCSDPLSLGVLDAPGVLTARGLTTSATNNGGGLCGGSSANDLVYSFTLTVPQRVQVELVPDPNYHPTVHVREICDVQNSQLGCKSGSAAGETALLELGTLGPGTYYVWADGWPSGAQGAGSFTLTVTATAAALPENDTCAGAKEIKFGVENAVTASTVEAKHDYRGLCGWSSNWLNGADLVYYFTLDETAQVTAQASRADTSFRPAVIVRTVCDSSAPEHEAACARDNIGVSTATAVYPPGTYYVIVGGVSTSRGAFTLELTRSATYIAGDSCLNPLTPEFNLDGATVLSGDLAGATSSGHGTCQTAAAPDVVYRLVLPTDRAVEVDAVPPSPGWRPVVYLRSACGDHSDASQLFCVNATSSVARAFRIPRVSAGTYWLWVDRYSTYEGPYEVTVTLSDPDAVPSHDTCREPEPLAFDPGTGVATVEGSTFRAKDDYTGTCGAMTGPDVVYRLILSENKRATAVVTRGAGDTTFANAVYIRSSCESALPEDQLACAVNSSGVATATAFKLFAGVPYFVIVDGTSGTLGRFQLEVQLGPPLPNDCSSVEEIPIVGNTGTASGDNTLVVNSTGGSCGGSSGVDLVYSFTLGSERPVTASVHPKSSMRLALYARTSCGDTGTQLGCQLAPSNGSDVSLNLGTLPSGTYYLWVDMYSGTKGGFDLTLTLGGP